jgi:hypothetical protein
LIQYANQTQPIVSALLCINGVNVLSLKSIAYKLQKALTFKGRYVTINQNQFYSEALKKMSTKYILKEKVKEKGKKKYKTLLETFRLIDVVNYLADILKEGE